MIDNQSSEREKYLRVKIRYLLMLMRRFQLSKVKNESQKQEAKKINKNVIYIILFSIFISVNYFDLFGENLQNFRETLIFRTTSGIPIYLNFIQIWIYNIVSLLFDSIFVAIAVGILGYYIKNLKLYTALLYGILVRYGVFIVWIFVYGISINADFITQFRQAANIQVYIILTLQLLATLYFSYLGFKIGKNSLFLDKKDEELSYFYGIPKKIWALLIIAYNPVVNFLSGLTIILIYETTNKITSSDFWVNALHNIFNTDYNDGIINLFLLLFSIPAAWTLTVYLFKYGLDAIKDKEIQYRRLKISFVFILIPILIFIIPLFRNETWFF